MSSCLLVMGDFVLLGTMTKQWLTWVSMCWAPPPILGYLIIIGDFSKARQGAGVGMMMQRLVWASPLLGQAVQILVGVWSLCMKYCGLFLLKQRNLIFSCKNAVQK